MAGRSTKLTKELTQRVCEGLALGHYVCAVCDLCGISQSIFYEWRKNGEADKAAGLTTPCSEFLDATTYAMGEAEQSALQAIKSAFSEDWRAAAHFLERRYSDRWARRDKTEVDVKTEGGVILLPPKKTADDWIKENSPE